MGSQGVTRPTLYRKFAHRTQETVRSSSVTKALLECLLAFVCSCQYIAFFPVVYHCVQFAQKSNTAVPRIVQTPPNRTESEASDPRFGPGMIDFLALVSPCLSTSYRVASPQNTEGCSSQERKHARPIDVNWQRRRTRRRRTKNVHKKTTKRSFNVVLPPPFSANRVCFPNPRPRFPNAAPFYTAGSSFRRKSVLQPPAGGSLQCLGG